MLAHLPGRMSQPSIRGVTSNILILRCSFHETAKRLSITGLTHLLRLRSEIQSSIVRHLPSKSPTTKMTIWTSFCATLTGTNLSLLLTGLSYTICDFATNKNGKEIRSITNNTKLSVWLTNFRLLPKWRHTNKKKSRIGILQKKTNLLKASN